MAEMTRREWIASIGMTRLAPAERREIVIASANGERACRRALELLRQGADTLDAVIEGVTLVELDPDDTSVGYGGLPNENGEVELDACVMHGPTRRCGAVAALKGIKTPSKVARVVMEQSDHIMLVGEGALRFALLHGFRQEELLTEKARLAWLAWKRSLRDPEGHNNWGPGLDAPAVDQAVLRRWFPNVEEETLAWIEQVIADRPTGTITCLALNRRGEMSGVTSTSGLAWKIPGRVGDSPIIGAGLFVDQDVGAAGSTGRGEENIRVVGAHTVVENMRRGMSPQQAVLDCLERVARNFGRDLSRLRRFDLRFYALRNDGAYAAAALWDRWRGRSPARFVVGEGDQVRYEACAFLYRWED